MSWIFQPAFSNAWSIFSHALSSGVASSRQASQQTISGEAYLFPIKKAIVLKVGLAEETHGKGLSGAELFLVYLVPIARIERMAEKMRGGSGLSGPEVYLVCLVCLVLWFVWFRGQFISFIAPKKRRLGLFGPSPVVS